MTGQSSPENPHAQIRQGGWGGGLLPRRSVVASNGAVEPPGKNHPVSPATPGTMG